MEDGPTCTQRLGRRIVGVPWPDQQTEKFGSCLTPRVRSLKRWKLGCWTAADSLCQDVTASGVESLGRLTFIHMITAKPLYRVLDVQQACR